MKELIIAEKDGLQVLSARDLYEKLEITDRFSRWFESLLKYGFQENVDFWCVKTSTQQNQYGGVKELDDFSLTLDMAKQICMIQRSEKGRQYREYLLKLEKAWNTPEAVMARALQFANRTLENAQKEIQVMKPKAEAYDHFLAREQFTNFRDASSYLGISQTDFMNLLKSKYIYKNSVGEYRAYSDYAKYFTLRPYDRGNDKVGQQLMLNITGLEFFRQKLA